MALDPRNISIYHITNISNLPSILKNGGLNSDAIMQNNEDIKSTVIGYNHIKLRRLKELTIPCCHNAFVGEFVPFYFCPRSPMLYTINKGRTNHPVGCQTDILHLVSTVSQGIMLHQQWCYSDGNAGARFTSFFDKLDALDNLDWAVISSNDWSHNAHKKAAEFLIKDFFPWNSFTSIGCYNHSMVTKVNALLAGHQHHPIVQVKSNWYY